MAHRRVGHPRRAKSGWGEQSHFLASWERSFTGIVHRTPRKQVVALSRTRIQALVAELLEVDPSASPEPGTLPLAVPPFGEDEVVEAISALLEGRVTMGERVFEFERRYAKHTGTEHAIMVNSGSSALLVMLEALIEVGHLQRGDEVLLPAVGWSTDLFSVAQAGSDASHPRCRCADLVFGGRIRTTCTHRSSTGLSLGSQ